MRRYKVIAILVLLVLSFSACWQEETLVEEPPLEEPILEEAVQDEDTEINEDSLSLFEEIIPFDRIGYNGNTTGNSRNHGYVGYDRDGKHLLSIGSSIYSFDPKTEELTLIVSLSDGRPSYLNVLGGDILFINSEEGKLYKFKSEDKQLELLDERSVDFLATMSGHIVYTAQVEFLSGEFRKELVSFNPNNERYITLMTSSFNEINVHGARVYSAGYPNIRVFSDVGPGGRTGHFVDDFDEFKELLVFIDDIRSYSFAIVGLEADTSILFRYKDGELTELVSGEDVGGSIRNINYAGDYLYFVAGSSGSNRLMKLNHITLELSKIASLPSAVANLFLVNNWVYYTDNQGNMYQLKPSEDQAKKITP